MIDKFGKGILTMFGIGHFKYAPGTIASFVTCLVFFVLLEHTSLSQFKTNKTFLISFLIILCIYSIVLIDKFYKKSDAKEIVIDEFIGQSIPLIAIFYMNFTFAFPIGYLEFYSIAWIVLSFLLFRFFDILKPFPINIIDRKIKNGIGVMLDDIIAGIFSAISIYILYSLRVVQNFFIWL